MIKKLVITKEKDGYLSGDILELITPEQHQDIATSLFLDNMPMEANYHMARSRSKKAKWECFQSIGTFDRWNILEMMRDSRFKTKIAKHTQNNNIETYIFFQY